MKEKVDLCSLDASSTKYYPSFFLHSDIINLFFPLKRWGIQKKDFEISGVFFLKKKKRKAHRRVSLRAKNTKNANKHCQAKKGSVLQKKSTVGVIGAWPIYKIPPTYFPVIESSTSKVLESVMFLGKCHLWSSWVFLSIATDAKFYARLFHA